ncbi:unnamed protein product [Aphanomyces euteiches]|uniref:GATOR1 complex protein NPRL3 C-terminal HTH domain-containing protein n=1 Tax=Aphanomyces euteiches TaxID=100861 RepID=A0A6G0WU83_9STRA|nr:hypothetical protein Ae201684_011625 [Aphanomyces euteiches]KAH9097120.1 hypothetical protein Ae201684P_011846 [Aphanomyces euteiches]KAH9156610.1 hypothetical protein AeRB84_001473 [Aphanomyces euteiches]
MRSLTLGCCTGIALVVDDIHKGCNLAFRYPAPQSDSHMSAFHRLSSALIAKLFRPKNVLCNQTFQLVIDDLRFISHPVTINLPTSSNPPSSNSQSSTVSGRRDTSMFNVIFALDDTKLDEILPSASSQEGHLRAKKVDAFAQVASQLAHALLHEETRVGFVTSEVRELLHLRDEIAQNERQLAQSMDGNGGGGGGTADTDTQEIDVDPQTLIDVALGKSVLANDLKAVYHGLEEDGSVHVVINRWVQLSLTLFDTTMFSLNAMRPYHTLLLLHENDKILDALPADSSPQLRVLIEAHNPLRDFQELMLETGIPLKQLFRLAAHLVYWGVARVIDAVTMHNIYHVQPTANIHSQSALALEFRRRFTSFELAEVLATFTGKNRLSVYMNTLTQHRKLEYIHMLIWLLQHEFIAQLHRYVYLVIPQDAPPYSPAVASSPSDSPAVENDYVAQLARKTNTPNPVLDLFRRLEPYFHGQHHLVEIMWRENVTRVELRTVLSTYKHILVLADHE